VSSSFSPLAISKSSAASFRPDSIDRMRPTTPSRSFFSRPRSCARLASFQTSGASSARSISIRRVCLTSKSKIPPEFDHATAKVGDQGVEGIQAFGFHGVLSGARRAPTMQNPSL
jgi:hypothetical protein